jgi:hypothetical protein
MMTYFNEDRRIDYIFTNAHVLSYEVISKKYVDGAFPSDHFPVMITADLSLKPFPVARFAETMRIVKHLPYDGSFTNEFTGNFTGQVHYTSSNTDCATVDDDGLVTPLSDGETTITAITTETEDVASISISYLLRVFTLYEHNIETFNGAGPMEKTYTDSYMSGISSATGIAWTVIRGSINKLANFADHSVIIRGKLPSESQKVFANVYSNAIPGGIDALSFEWNSNGSETGRTWDISIFINDKEVGKITEPGTAQIPAGGPFNKFSIDNLKIPGNFTIKIVNNSTASSESNQYRFVFDNLEWTSYDGPTSTSVIDRHPIEIYPIQDAIQIRSTEAVQSVNIYNISGVLLAQTQQRTIISMQAFTPGIYLIEVVLNNGERVVKKLRW